MGLSFVKEIVDLHGGRILVQSEPTKGSIFSILLPAKGDSKAKEAKEVLHSIDSLGKGTE